MSNGTGLRVYFRSNLGGTLSWARELSLRTRRRRQIIGLIRRIQTWSK